MGSDAMPRRPDPRDAEPAQRGSFWDHVEDPSAREDNSRGAKRHADSATDGNDRWSSYEAASKLPRADAVDPEKADKIAKGEAMVQEGRRLSSAGQLKEAHKTYQKGLKALMSVMPDNGEDTDSLPQHEKDFLKKIDEYLSEIEELDQRIKEQKRR